MGYKMTFEEMQDTENWKEQEKQKIDETGELPPAPYDGYEGSTMDLVDKARLKLGKNY